MTDAFRCDGCDEYYDDEFRFLELEMETDVANFADFTLDDIPTEAYSILYDSEGANTGDFCPECGMTLLEDLLARFRGGDDGAE